MLSAWTCSPCVVILLSAVLGREAVAAQIGKRHKDLLHMVDKVDAQVTAHPKKRDATVCPSSYDLCPASLHGGCCPPRYGCETDACYATTAGIQSACGLEGYYNCGVSAGGGCCPDGYICGADNCTPPVGVSSILTSCPARYYLCPASFNYGCCMSGYGCATNACYITTPSTGTYTATLTTTDAGGQAFTATLTATTIMTPTAPTALPTTPDANAIPKFIPTSVAKFSATSSASTKIGGVGGLTKPQLGGIIGGAIAILLVVVTAAFIIIRRLHRVADGVHTARISSSGDHSKSTRPGRPNMAQYGRPAASEFDGMGYDPLIMSTPGDSSAGTPHTLVVHGRNRSDSDYSQPAVTPYNFSGTPSNVQHRTDVGSNPSALGYFTIPARVHNIPGRASMRTSVDSRANVQQHNRQWSNASELSNGSSNASHGVGSPLMPAELDIAGGFIPELPSANDDSVGEQGRRRSGSSSVASPRPSLNNTRRHSSSSAVAPSVPSPSMAGSQPLDPVSESSEVMHGHYGPRHGQVGQTAAGLGWQP